MNDIITNENVTKFAALICRDKNLNTFKLNQKFYRKNGTAKYQKKGYNDEFSIKITSIYYYDTRHCSIMIFMHSKYILIVSRIWPIINENSLINDGILNYWFSGNLEMLEQHLIQMMLSNE